MAEPAVLPLLKLQRDLYELPLGMDRFRAYLAALTDPVTGEASLPLPAFNPMGKAHVAETLDHLIRLDAEAVAAEAIVSRLGAIEGLPFQIGLVVADDRGGGWTNRAASELQNDFRPTAMLRRGWAVVLFWTTETATVDRIRSEVLKAVHRNRAIHQNGEPGTLGAILDLEAAASAFAAEPGPTLPDDERAYTHWVLESLRGSDDFGTILASMFGDEAARSLGLTPLGLSPRAGYRLAAWQGTSSLRSGPI